MAHPCCICGSECYCNGDIDDCIISKTPKKCESCGCEDDDSWRDDERGDEPEYWYCIGCHKAFGEHPGTHCPRCSGATIEGVY